MTTQFDFTNDEWSDIATLPVLVGYAVAQAEDSGRIGSFLELRALTNTISEPEPGSGNAARGLIEAASVVDIDAKLESFDDHDPALLADVAVQSCHEIARVIEGRADAPETDAYKAWVIEVAYQVANAARENGIRLSQPEAALLERFKQALAIG